MPARTGEDFLRGLKDDRRVWVGDDRVSDVAGHPAFAGAARFVASLFDLQHEAAAVCLMPDPETGEPINVSHLIPRSRQDLERRHACLERIAEWSVGIMGRTPDYMNITFAGFAGRERRVVDRRQRARRGQPGGLPEAAGAAGPVADPHPRPSDGGPGVGGRAGRGQRRRAPQGGRHRARHRGAGRADPGHPRPVRRRAGGLSGRAAAPGSRRLRARRSRSRWPRPASSSSAATA